MGNAYDAISEKAGCRLCIKDILCIEEGRRPSCVNGVILMYKELWMDIFNIRYIMKISKKQKRKS